MNEQGYRHLLLQLKIALVTEVPPSPVNDASGIGCCCWWCCCRDPELGFRGWCSGLMWVLVCRPCPAEESFWRSEEGAAD